ncbi:MAG: T9SS type A sorting domain-containing protein [Bacteroidota bacterium]|nr:T9SS type A sorting domain-containing protein [Bacteroidota bacterium]
MKKSTYILLCVLLPLGLGLLSSDINFTHKKARAKLLSKNYPSDFFFHQRAWPSKSININSYKKAIDEIVIKVKEKNTTLPAQLSWDNEGPGNIGGRINEVLVHPTNSNIIYSGSAAGGIFKTTDGGTSWYPIFDEHAYLAIGELVFDPQNPDIIFVGTGDPNITGYPAIGDGIYKSADAGQTWQHLGLSEVGVISRIAIDTANSNLIYVAAMGLPFEEDTNRGLYKSTDGGQNWQQVLFVDEDAGIIDMIVVPNNTQTIYASSWNRIRNNSESIIYGTDTKIFKSTNGGNTWNILSNGLPTSVMSRIGICMSASDTSLLYAVYVNTNLNIGGLYKTTDAGASWTSLPISNPLSYAYSSFGWYFGQIRISPYNNNELFILGVDLYKSMNGGASWNAVGPNWATNDFYADKHDLVYIDSLTIVCSTDGGLYKSTDGGYNWTDIDNIPNTQFYRVAVDPHNPGCYAGGSQDNGTLYGNINTFYSWDRIFGGDGFQPLFDYNNPNIKYVETQNGALYYKSGIYWQYFGTGINSGDRRSWDMPIIMSSHDPSHLYTGTYRIYKNSNAPTGSWSVISPDLTDGGSSKFHVISCLAESSLDSNILYTGTSDGNVCRSLNGGTSWDDIYSSLPNRYVTSVKASPNFANSVFVSHSGYRDNDFIPHIHKSNDYGNTWTDISGDMPEIAVNDLIILDGYADFVIFAATDGGIYFTDNGGIKWARLCNDMPIVPIYDIEYDQYNQKIIAGSFARSMISVSIDSLLTIVSINEPSEIFKAKTSIYPNPASSYITISGLPKDVEYARIISLKGEVVRSFRADELIANRKISVTELNSGIYSLVIESVSGKTSLNFLVIRDII